MRIIYYIGTALAGIAGARAIQYYVVNPNG